MMNSKDFGSRAPAQNCISGHANGGSRVVTKENGFGFSEKRMRNDGFVASPSVQDRLGSFPAGGFQDFPDAPLRKRVHVSESVIYALGGVKSEVNGVIDSEEGKSVIGVDTPTRWDVGKKSGSDGKYGGPSAGLARTSSPRKVNSKGVEEAKGRLTVCEDLIVNPEAARETTVNVNRDRAFVPVEQQGVASETDVTDMEIDSTSPNKEVLDGTVCLAAVEEVGEELQKGDNQIDAEQAQNSADLFVKTFRGRSSGPDHAVLPQSEDFRQLPSGHEESSQRHLQRGLPQLQRTVEVIEFDDSDDDEVSEKNVHESDGSSTEGKKPFSRTGHQSRRNGYRLSSSESTAASYNPGEDGDSDDCQVVGSWRPPWAHNVLAANPVIVDEDDDTYSTSVEESGDSSDSEEVAGSQSSIRRRWEEAAMRRRLGRAMRSAGSKADGEHGGTIDLDDYRTESQGLEESVATSTYRDSPDSKDQTETSGARGLPERVVSGSDGLEATTSRVHEQQRPLRGSHVDDFTLNGVINEGVEMKITDAPADPERLKVLSSPGADQRNICRAKSERREVHDGTELEMVDTRSTRGHSESRKEVNSQSGDQTSDEGLQSRRVVFKRHRDETSENQDGMGDDTERCTGHVDLLVAKERLKQTAQYRKTDEAEWAARQLEIHRQALESKRLRLRKRQEAERKREMERKQKERIEELRKSQMKEEKNINMRDQLRGQVRTELERIAASCNDFATLLRQLGIPVEGGSQPSTKQVNAAYKKALFKFHPDRAVALSQGEPRYQVEAEEKFKLIQRSKDTLVPVANDYPFSAYRSFW